MKTLMLVISFSIASGVAAADGVVELFNGKDLTGWVGDTSLWSVEDGAITGKTNGPDHLKYNKFLIWDGGEVGDFELTMKFRLEGKNNSGVQYRSRRLQDKGEWVVGGYQADIHENPPYTGMLYDERGRGILAQRGQKVVVNHDGKKLATKLDVDVKPIDLTKWHELTIIARGPRITHKIDGVTTIELIDQQANQRELEGIIALQVHRGPAMKAQFKDIRLKHLPKPPKKAPRKAPKNSATQASAAKPVWIWSSTDKNPTAEVFFRKEFKVSGAIAAARLFVAADNKASVYLDGKPVLDHAGFDDAGFKDVTAMFEKPTPDGKHVLAVRAENVGEDNPAGLLVRLDLESGWRDAWSIVSDASWKVSEQALKGWHAPHVDYSDWPAATVVAELGGAPWTKLTAATLAAAAPLREPTATDPATLKVAKDFHVELLHSVPKDVEGSWVSMCVDPKGRLIVSDQYGGLFRVTPPAIGSDAETKIEKVNVDIGEAQGLLWAFDSLYVVVNRGKKYPSGLYRVRDTNGDDQLDSLETLRLLDGGAEHGPHAVLLAPDGKSLYVVCGNKTKIPELNSSRVPRIWDEDLLLPRTYGRGFMKGTPAPGGFICRIDPDGKEWELVATGFRNEYDAAFNADGELFAYDADMEWDMNTPWYRPTRVCQVTSGAEFGWRNGAGKWPAFYADSLPAVANVGPGSPTGVCFGYGAKFPAKYQQAMFLCDWSYGKLYALHLRPSGSTYTGELEEFITGTPLPLTDIVVNPHDSAMYFMIGGRKVQSGLYRVTYRGDDPTAPASATSKNGAEARQLRRDLEELHVGDHPEAVKKAWPYLDHSDRFVRFAARVAIEHRPLEEWRAMAMKEKRTQAALTALLAMARKFEREFKGRGADIDSPAPNWGTVDASAESIEKATARAEILRRLAKLEWDELTTAQRLGLLRVYTVAFARLGPPTAIERQDLLNRFSRRLHSSDRRLNSELAQLLVYLQDPKVAPELIALLLQAPTQEQQIDIAKTLRHLRVGWTAELREAYFKWFTRASAYRGGASFSLFVQHIKDDAVALLTDEEKAKLKPILEAPPATGPAQLFDENRPLVRDWKMTDLAASVQNGLHSRDFNRGQKMFAAAKCFACHRFDNQGGAVGPDLTSLAGRFSPRDILESIIEPSKEISDQYGAVNVITLDGRIVTGRIVNLAGNSIRINTDMLNPDAQVGVDRKLIDEILPSKTSMMPVGLLNTLNKDEILDLLAYLVSRGDRNSPVFQEQD